MIGKPLTRYVTVHAGPWNLGDCSNCGMKVDPACGCLNGRAADRRDAITKSVADCIRIASKPRARLIPAFSVRSRLGEPDWPSRDTWVVRKTLNGRIVRGYGYTLDGAIADFKSMYDLAFRASVLYRESW